MCIGRVKDGMVKEPVWKGAIKINHQTFFVKVYRPRRDILTGQSIYLAETEYNGEIICVDNKEKGIDEVLTLMKKNLIEKIRNK